MFTLKKVTYSVSFECRFENGLLIVVNSFRLFKVLNQESLEKGVKADGGHVVHGQDNLLLQEVVRLPLQNVQEDFQKFDNQSFGENLLKEKANKI